MKTRFVTRSELRYSLRCLEHALTERNVYVRDLEASLAALDADPEAPRRLRDRRAREWREEAWRCYCESGADPDGADARHLNPGEAVEAVKELRRDYEACAKRAESASEAHAASLEAERRLSVAREALERIDEDHHGCTIARKALATLDGEGNHGHD